MYRTFILYYDRTERKERTDTLKLFSLLSQRKKRKGLKKTIPKNFDCQRMVIGGKTPQRGRSKKTRRNISNRLQATTAKNQTR